MAINNFPEIRVVEPPLPTPSAEAQSRVNRVAVGLLAGAVVCSIASLASSRISGAPQLDNPAWGLGILAGILYLGSIMQFCCPGPSNRIIWPVAGRPL